MGMAELNTYAKKKVEKNGREPRCHVEWRAEKFRVGDARGRVFEEGGVVVEAVAAQVGEQQRASVSAHVGHDVV